MKVFTLVTLAVICLLATGAESVRKCDQRDRNFWIYVGYIPVARSWPSHGALFHRSTKDGNQSYACGVTILSERFVITVAHCTMDRSNASNPKPLSADQVFVKFGLTNLDIPEKSVQQHNVSSIIRHGEYDADIFDNDIALLKLNTTIAYTRYVKPISLWEENTDLKDIVSQIGYIVGWGCLQGFGPASTVLHEATMPIASRKECIAIDTKFYYEHKTFCAGYRNGTTAAPGDSGGGLYLKQGRSYVLRGLISNIQSVYNGVDTSSFVVLTDVTYYLPWIESHMNYQSRILMWWALFICFSFACTIFCAIVTRRNRRNKEMYGYLNIDAINISDQNEK